ncbi:MAG TPA: enoyl-CoA hydratase/isomerase family protein [Burkholderiaceae bacterium]|nr:enoyl-CoA hydratase/isomerase family protein [Burkholderiaceae bacterium]
MPSTLKINITHRVAIVWMARAEVRNAFNETTIAELTETFRALGADPEVRAIVLAAEGPAFCAGADLDWMRRMAQYSNDENRADALKLATMLRTIHECPKPVIARIHGPAFAGGVGLVAACDIAVASITAEFCLTETKLGLIPATIAPYVMRAMGANQARRYFLTAEKFDAGEAYRIGLVHNIAPPEALDGAINELLGALMLTSAEAVTEAKRLVRDLAFRPIDDALVADTAERIAAIRQSADGREGIASFLEKRKPRWVAEYEALAADLEDDEEM